MKGLTVFLALAVLALTGFEVRQSNTLKRHDRQLAAAEATIKQLAEGANEKPKVASLELQGQCAKQAMEMFRYSGLDKDQLAGFTSHYNPELGRCFTETTNTKSFGKTIWTYKQVYDAYEQKQFADYSWHTEGDKKYWEVPPFTCSVRMPNSEERHCRSSEEFDELIKAYMGR